MADAEKVTKFHVQQDLLDTQAKLLRHVREEQNWLNVVAAAQAFALVSGTLTSTTTLQAPQR